MDVLRGTPGVFLVSTLCVIEIMDASGPTVSSEYLRGDGHVAGCIDYDFDKRLRWACGCVRACYRSIADVVWRVCALVVR